METKYLGLIITPGGLKTNPNKVSAIVTEEVLETKRAL